jgi:chlorobactene glucosyltransferase
MSFFTAGTPGTFFYNQQVGILFFCAALWLILLGNLFGMRRLGRRSAVLPEPFVSVLIPARNESVNVEACVRSLLAQDYDPFELLVLDDASTDGTLEILTRLAAESPRLRVLRGAPPPDGWVGKNWACHQLAQAARGDFLIFLDADTRAHPALLGDLVSLASRTDLEYFSGVPRQETRTLAERLIVPMVPWIAHNLTPIPLVRALPLSFLATAVGQCMFFRREAYTRMGGHAAVKAVIVEDFALARRAKRLGLRWDLVDVSLRLTTRMYHTLAEAWDGFSKSLFGAFHYNLPAFAFVWAWMLLVFWQPWIGLALSLSGHPLKGFSSPLAILTILIQMGLWTVTALRFRSSLLQIPLHPLTVAFFAAAAARSAWRYYCRRPLEWRGRRLPVKK